ncbi:MAG: class I SAM-dependent methyltransferase [Terracidiphilus sp.]|jgi:predicted O-methyltransferase YrrM
MVISKLKKIGPKLKQLGWFVRDWGIKGSVETLFCKAADNLLRRGLHKTSIPTLSTLYKSAESVFTNPDELLKHTFEADSLELAKLRREYDDTRSEILRRYENRSLSFPRLWSVEEGSAFLLYAITRLTRPSTVLETGVANGHSSLLILNALDRNAGPGELHSVDVSPKVGELIDSSERTRWHLNLLPLASLKRSFRDKLAAMPQIDIMLQDSDHSYRWIDFELETALPRMSLSGFLLCDDADLSFALIDFCQVHGLKPVFLVDTRKVFAVIPLRNRK